MITRRGFLRSSIAALAGILAGKFPAPEPEEEKVERASLFLSQGCKGNFALSTDGDRVTLHYTPEDHWSPGQFHEFKLEVWDAPYEALKRFSVDLSKVVARRAGGNNVA